MTTAYTPSCAKSAALNRQLDQRTAELKTARDAQPTPVGGTAGIERSADIRACAGRLTDQTTLMGEQRQALERFAQMLAEEQDATRAASKMGTRVAQCHNLARAAAQVDEELRRKRSAAHTAVNQQLNTLKDPGIPGEWIEAVRLSSLSAMS